MKIGLYDSGLGGLTILKSIAARLPVYDYVFYGDTKSLPLGDKSEREIYELTKKGVEYLFERDCALVIIACNTASAETLRRLQDEYLPTAYPDRRILGVIIPVIEEVIESGCNRVKLIATRRTVSSGKYHLELGKRNALSTKIEAIATPELVPLIEANEIDDALSAAVEALGAPESLVGEVDGIVLGCTHYIMLKAGLRSVYGSAIRVFSQDEIIPEKLAMYLDGHPEIESRLSQGGTRLIHLTEQREAYDRLTALLLEGPFIVGQ